MFGVDCGKNSDDVPRASARQTNADYVTPKYTHDLECTNQRIPTSLHSREVEAPLRTDRNLGILQSIKRYQASQIVFYDWPLVITDFKPQAFGVGHHDRDIARPVRQGSQAQ